MIYTTAAHFLLLSVTHRWLKECNMMILQYRLLCAVGYTTKDIVYRWLKGALAVDVDAGVTMSQFEIGQINFDNTTRTNRIGESVEHLPTHLHS